VRVDVTGNQCLQRRSCTQEASGRKLGDCEHPMGSQWKEATTFDEGLRVADLLEAVQLILKMCSKCEKEKPLNEGSHGG
jgi:hypothetical protein